MKRILALLMALALLCTSVCAFAAEETPTDLAPQAETPENPDLAPNDWTNKYEDRDEFAKHEGHKIQMSSDETENVPASCTTEGKTKYACYTCQVRCFKFEAKLEHTPKTTETPANSEIAGSKKTVCSTCGAVLEEEIILPSAFKGSNPDDYDLFEVVDIPNPDNDPNWLHVKGYALKANPDEDTLTCAEKEFGFYCIHCGQELTLKLSKGEHKADVENHYTTVLDWKEATCTEDGFYKYQGCVNCKDKAVVWIETVPKKGNHTYDENAPIETVEADCIHDGSKTYKCTACGENVKVKTKDKTGHSYDIKPDQAPQDYIVPATCIATGKYSKAVICTVCGVVKPGSEDVNLVDTIDVLKHQEHLDALVDMDTFFKEVVDHDEDGNEIIRIVVQEGIEEGEKKWTGAEVKNADDKVIGKYGDLKVVYTPATCTEKGHISVTCTNEGCKASIEQDLTPLGHEIDEEKYKGYFELGQNNKQWEDCTKPNSAMIECVRFEKCGYRFNVQLPIQKAHSYKYEWVIGYAQVRHGGNLAKYYAEDYMSEDENAVDFEEALKLAFAEIAVCNDYYEIIKCDRCLHQEPFLVKGNEKHKCPEDPALYTKNPATCTEDGFKYYKCEYCGLDQYEILEHEGHKMVNGIALENATCTKAGLREIYCSVCGTIDEKGKVIQSVVEEKGVQTKVIPTIDHEWTVYEKKADCQKGTIGESYDICSMCHLKKNEKTWSGHQPKEGTLRITKAATCTETGLQNFTCEICHKTITNDVIPAKGHTYQRVDNKVISVEDFIEKHENTCKEYKMEAGCTPKSCLTGDKHVVICGECKVPLKWETDNAINEHLMFTYDGEGKEHLTTTFVILEVPTCETAGKAVYNCTRCQSVETYELPKLPHNLSAQFDPKKGLWYFECQKIKHNEAGLDVLTDLISKVYKNPEIGQAVYNEMCFKTPEGQNFAGFGANDHGIEVPILKTEYKIIVDGNDATVKLVDENMMELDPVYLRATWRYTLANGETVGVNHTIFPDSDGVYYIDDPEIDGHRDYLLLHVVTDRVAHRKDFDEFTSYGSLKLK